MLKLLPVPAAPLTARRRSRPAAPPGAEQEVTFPTDTPPPRGGRGLRGEGSVNIGDVRPPRWRRGEFGSAEGRRGRNGAGSGGDRAGPGAAREAEGRAPGAAAGLVLAVDLVLAPDLGLVLGRVLGWVQYFPDTRVPGREDAGWWRSWLQQSYQAVKEKVGAAGLGRVPAGAAWQRLRCFVRACRPGVVRLQLGL